MKPVLLLTTFLFSLFFSNAQPVQIGIKGGLNLAEVAGINTDYGKARLGWNAGLFTQIPVQDNLLIRPELLYSSKGAAYSASANSSEGSLRLNYISVPVLFGYRPTPKASILVGPEFGFLAKAVSKSQGITTDMTGFRHLDIGVDLGVTYNLSRYFGMEARYNYGFKDLVNAVYLDTNGNIAGQGKTGANRVIQLGVYYLLGD